MTHHIFALDLTTLSPAQRKVARLMGTGMNNKEIGQALKRSPRTVEIHVAAVLKSFDVSRYRFIYAFAKWGCHE